MLSLIAERSDEEAAALVRPAGEIMSYGALAMAAAALRQALDARVGDVGQRLVAIAVSDGAGFVATLLAVLEAGGVALPLDPQLGVEGLVDEARRARAVALVTGDAAEDRLDVLPGDATRRALPAEAALALPAGARRALVSRDGAEAAAGAIAGALGLARGVRVALTGPLAQPSVLVGQVLATLLAGGTLVDVSALPAAAQLEAMTRLGVGVLTAFPSQLGELADARRLHGAPAPPLARIVATGAPLSRALADELAAAFPGARLADAYGSAEALGVTHADSGEPGFATGALGRPLDAVAVTVDDGELLVRSPWLMLGYLDDADATRAAFVTRDGERWLRTGERARRDGDRVLLLGRSDGAIEVGGERVDPAALEARLRERDGVDDAAVIAVPDPRLGWRVVAFVVGPGRPSAPPARVVALASLPRTADGAVDREALRRMVSPD